MPEAAPEAEHDGGHQINNPFMTGTSATTSDDHHHGVVMNDDGLTEDERATVSIQLLKFPYLCSFLV